MSNQEKRSCIQLFEGKVKTNSLLSWSGLGRSSYYYKCRSGKRGRKPSTHTRLTDGTVISNESVVIAIRFVLAEEFMIGVGYINISKDLQSYGFVINKKKVYHLMKTHQLLLGSVIRTSGEKRVFVSWRVQVATKPMEQLCIDIKYVYIHGEKKNALLLTVLDVYSRCIIGQVLWWRIRKEHVIWLLHQELQQHHTTTITLRNDNGSQFIANIVRQYLKDIGVQQEFTHVATPEENCFIEAYHSILERQLLKYWEFENIDEAQAVFNRWKKFYNERKRHGSLGRKTPKQIWDEYDLAVESLRQQTAAKPEQKSRPAATSPDALAAAASYSLDFCGGEAIFAKSESTNTEKKTNCFEENVQLLGG